MDKESKSLSNRAREEGKTRQQVGISCYQYLWDIEYLATMQQGWSLQQNGHDKLYSIFFGL